MDNKIFNLIITGVGGQGLITLLSIIDEAAFVEGYDVRSSELHGLSQRGGSVKAHIRFGKKVNSPMITDGKADIIIALELFEALRESLRSGKQTDILVNDYYFPFPGALSAEETRKQLSANKNLYLIPASEKCKENLQNEIVSTLYMLGYAVKRGLIPLKKEAALKAIQNIIPEKYRELNINAFNLAYDN